LLIFFIVTEVLFSIVAFKTLTFTR